MDVINILLFGIILLVAFGDYLITKFKRKSEEKILIGDEKAKHKKPFLSFLSSSTFIVFFSLTLILIIYIATDLSSDLLPDLYFPEVLIAICLGIFYAIFSVKTYMSKITKDKIIAREILYFTLNVFVGLLMGFSFVLIPPIINDNLKSLKSKRTSINNFKTNFKYIEGESYVPGDNSELKSAERYDIKLEKNGKTFYKLINFNSYKNTMGAYPNYYVTKYEWLKYPNFIKSNLVVSDITKAPGYRIADNKFYSEFTAASQLNFSPSIKGDDVISPNLLYLGKLKITRKVNKYKYVYNHIKKYKFNSKPPPRNSYFFNSFKIQRIAYDWLFSSGSSNYYPKGIYHKYKGAKDYNLFVLRDVFGEWSDKAAVNFRKPGGILYGNISNPYFSLSVELSKVSNKDYEDVYNRICGTWDCNKRKKSITIKKTPSKNIELVRYLKGLKEYHSGTPDNLYNEFVNQDNFNELYQEEFLYKVKSDINLSIQKLDSKIKAYRNSYIHWNFYSETFSNKLKFSYALTFILAYVTRLIVILLALLSKLFLFVIKGYKWAFKTYFD